MTVAEQIRAATAIIPNFPKTGVNFIDITTVLEKPNTNEQAVNAVKNLFCPDEYDIIVSPGARGWLLAQPIALAQKKPFIPARDPEKLPREHISTGSISEYDRKPIAIHTGNILLGAKVLMIDDVAATCGTAKAIIELVKSQGGSVLGLATLYDLPYLPDRVELPCPIRSIVAYEEPPKPYMPA